MSAAVLKLQLDEIGVDRGGEPVIADISLSVAAGECVQLFGRNGCGKSTLLQAIAGLIPLSRGSISWVFGEGQKSVARPEGMLSFVGHQTPFKSALTGRENLQFWAGTYRAQGLGDDQITAAVARAGLSHVERRRVAGYSAGQKRRLDLARLILAGRLVWLLDEPTASLDREGVDRWTEEISSFQKSGGMALIASHERLPLNSRNIQLA